MSRPHVIVVGGGLAGLRAALACSDAGARVTLLEARARLGGATWSTTRAGLQVDNGQHVFLRCCTAYRGFLADLGVEDRVVLQERLEVPVLVPGRAPAWIRRHRLPAPAHLAPSLLRFAPLALGQRLAVARTARRLAALDRLAPQVDSRRFGDWLAEQGESDAAIDGFWDLLVRPTLNLSARDSSLALAAKVFQTGLLSAPDAADIGWAGVPLAELHAEPAARLLRERGADVRLRARVDAVEGSLEGAPSLLADGERLTADAVVVAVPHDAAAELLPATSGVDAGALARLGASPIVNLHVVFDRPVTELAFAAGLGTPLQWIFDRTRSSGLARGQYLTVSLSAADAWVGHARDELRRVFLPAFEALFPAARAATVERFFVTCERAATFYQGPGTAALRPGPDLAWRGVHLAGAWTDTDWPATMEGAVKSGALAAQHALTSARGTASARAAA